MSRNVRIFLAVSMVLLALSQAVVAWAFESYWAYGSTAAATLAAVVAIVRLRRTDGT